MFFVFFSFSGFHLPERRNLDIGSWYNFCADIGALIYAQIFATDFCLQFVQILGAQCADFCADFSADFSSTFWFFKIGVPESRKMRTKSAAASQRPVREGSLFHPAALRRWHVTQ